MLIKVNGRQLSLNKIIEVPTGALLCTDGVIVIISKQLTSKRLISATHALMLLTLLSHTPAVVNRADAHLDGLSTSSL